MRRLLFLLILALPAGAAGFDGPWIAAAHGRVDVEGGAMRLAARREGVIAEVLAEEGDRVREGQPLARLDDRAARLEREVARGKFMRAEIEAEIAEHRAAAAAAAGRIETLARRAAAPDRERRAAEEARIAPVLGRPGEAEGGRSVKVILRLEEGRKGSTRGAAGDPGALLLGQRMVVRMLR